MKIGELDGSRFLKSEEVTGEIVVTIIGVDVETFEPMDGGRAKKKCVITVAELSKPIVCGPEAVESINKALGTTSADDSTLWLGQKLTLFVDSEVRFQGKRVGGLRFKRLVGPTKTVKPKAVKATDDGSLEALEDDIPF